VWTGKRMEMKGKEEGDMEWERERRGDSL